MHGTVPLGKGLQVTMNMEQGKDTQAGGRHAGEWGERKAQMPDGGLRTDGGAGNFLPRTPPSNLELVLALIP